MKALNPLSSQSYGFKIKKSTISLNRGFISLNDNFVKNLLLSFSFIFLLILFSSDVFAGTTSSHAAASTLDSAKDDVESLVGGVAPFIAILSFLVAVVNMVTKFSWVVFIPAFSVAMISSFGLDILNSFFSAII